MRPVFKASVWASAHWRCRWWLWLGVKVAPGPLSETVACRCHGTPRHPEVKPCPTFRATVTMRLLIALAALLPALAFGKILGISRSRLVTA